MITRKILEKYRFKCVFRLIWNIILAAPLLAPSFLSKTLRSSYSSGRKVQLQLVDKFQSPKAPAPALVTNIGHRSLLINQKAITHIHNLALANIQVVLHLKNIKDLSLATNIPGAQPDDTLVKPLFVEHNFMIK